MTNVTTLLESPTATAAETETKYGVIDTDVHPGFNLLVPEVLKHVPKKWHDYIAEFGLIRSQGPNAGERPRHREFAHRWDAVPPEGGQPMSNLDFARTQLLDQYDLTAALLTDIVVYTFSGRRGMPREMAYDFNRAINDYREEVWFEHDPRWYGSINLPYEVPNKAVEEIRRRMEGPNAKRWAQITMTQDLEHPMGNEKYWPIYEAAQEYNIPVSVHVLGGDRQVTSGNPSYYLEEHIDWAGWNFPTVSSLVFEGVFDRFPGLKLAFIEFGWSWAVPLSWRLDNSYNLFKSEVAHLERKPSEYIRDHMWYTTQPMEEPENPKWTESVFASFEASGMADKIMYSSDYPHWDFDEPTAMPVGLSKEFKRAVIGENASKLYNIPLLPNSGVVLP
jgi:predicted TIM-barrel fold metal-dependent hydrolase